MRTAAAPLPAAADQEAAESAFPSSWGDGQGLLAEAASADDILQPAQQAQQQPGAEHARGRDLGRAQRPSQRHLSAPPAVLPGDAAPKVGTPAGSAAGAEATASGVAGPSPEPPLAKVSIDFAIAAAQPTSGASSPAAAGELQGATAFAAGPEGTARSTDGTSTTWQALPLIWAPLTALGLSSTVALTLFPFFTYVPTSGLLGETLPKVCGSSSGQLYRCCSRLMLAR